MSYSDFYKECHNIYKKHKSIKHSELITSIREQIKKAAESGLNEVMLKQKNVDIEIQELLMEEGFSLSEIPNGSGNLTVHWEDSPPASPKSI